MPYPTSPPMTLLSNSLSYFGFTQPFAPFSPGPPGFQQMPLIPSRPLAAQESPTILTLEQCFLKAQELTLDLLYVKRLNFAIFLLPFLIIDVVLSSVIVLLLKIKRLTFYADHPLSTGLSRAQRVTTTFHSSTSFLVINDSRSSLADRDDLSAQNSPQGENSDTTIVLTVLSTSDIPHTPAIIPPSGPPSPKFPQVLSHTLQRQNVVVFTTRLTSSPTTSNIRSTLGATPKWHPSPSTNPMEPLPITAPTPLPTSVNDCSHLP